MHGIGAVLGGLLAHYGYLAVVLFFIAEGAGVPVPSETILVTAAAYAARGTLSVWGVIAAGALGGAVAGYVGYAIGAWGGLRLVRRFGRLFRIDEARLARARTFFRERGAGAAFLGRFLAWLRILVPMLAGVAEMPVGRFGAYNAAGSAGSAVVYGTLGYLFGRDLPALEHHIALTSAVAIAVALAAGVVVVVRRRRTAG